jgi:hypothetical protein
MHACWLLPRRAMAAMDGAWAVETGRALSRLPCVQRTLQCNWFDNVSRDKSRIGMAATEEKKKIQITTKHRDRQERKVQRRQGQMQAKEPGLRFACIGCNPTLVPPSLPLPRPMHPHHIRKSRDWLAAGFAPLPDGIPGRAFLCPGGAAEALQESLPFGTNR